MLKVSDLVLSPENPILNPLPFNFMAINRALLTRHDHIFFIHNRNSLLEFNRDREKKMLWTINHTFRVYLNFFCKKKKAVVEHSHFLFRCRIWVITVIDDLVLGVFASLPFPAIFMHLFIHFHPIRIVDDAFVWFLSHRYLIFNSILICNCSKLNLRAQCPNIVYIDEPFAYYLWTQRACSCFVLYCLDFLKHGSQISPITTKHMWLNFKKLMGALSE